MNVALTRHIKFVVAWTREQIEKHEAKAKGGHVSPKLKFHRDRLALLLKKHASILGSALLFMMLSAWTGPAAACNTCTGWDTWGGRMDICPFPSEGLFDDALACWRLPSFPAKGRPVKSLPAYGCATECKSWLDSYDACEASGDTACTFVTSTIACDNCIYARCYGVTEACSDDLTGSGCSYCVEILSGADPGSLCDYTNAKTAWDALGVCACSGACAASCATECSGGGLDLSALGPACDMCLQDTSAGCGNALEMCSSK